MDDLSENSEQNIMSGFRKTGINPIDANQVLSRLPEEIDVKGRENEVEKSVLDILKEMRYGSINIKEPKRKRKLEVIPGRSVGSSEDYEDTEEEPETVKGKAKGIGKMTKSVNDKEVIHDEKEVYDDEIHKKGFRNVDDKREKKLEKGKGKGKKSKGNKGKENEEKKVDVCQEKIDHADCLNKIKNTEIYCLSNEEIEAMSITIGDYILYDRNEIVIADKFTSTEDQDNLTPIINEESTNNKVNILTDEIISTSSTSRGKIQVNLNEYRKISPHSYVKSIDQPSTSSVRGTYAPARRSSYYTCDADILQDLMNEDVI
ncbi:unnamed protein product [Euphydryas editha]|nr:unnamed protein product [Euphydryas editha]